jgi:hypothetical protein
LEADGAHLLTYREVGELLGVGERAALNWVKERAIPVTPGRPARVALADVVACAEATGRSLPGLAADTPEALRKRSEAFGSASEVTGSGPEDFRSGEPIEAAYQVAGDAAPGAVLVPLQTMVEELRGLADQLAALAARNEGLALEVGQLRERVASYQTQLGAKDETIAVQAAGLAELRAAQEATIAAKDQAIAELRHRLDVAEAEALAARARPSPATPAAPDHEEEPATLEDSAPPPRLWGRLGRWWRGEG